MFLFFLSLLLSAAGRSVFPLFLIHPPRCNKNGWWRRVNQQHRKPPLFNSLKAKLRTVLTHSSCWQYWFLHVKKKTTPKQFFFKAYKHIKKALPTFSKKKVSNNESGSAKINQRCERIQSHKAFPLFSRKGVFIKMLKEWKLTMKSNRKLTRKKLILRTEASANPAKIQSLTSKLAKKKNIPNTTSSIIWVRVLKW